MQKSTERIISVGGATTFYGRWSVLISLIVSYGVVAPLALINGSVWPAVIAGWLYSLYVIIVTTRGVIIFLRSYGPSERLTITVLIMTFVNTTFMFALVWFTLWLIDPVEELIVNPPGTTNPFAAMLKIQTGTMYAFTSGGLVGTMTLVGVFAHIWAWTVRTVGVFFLVIIFGLAIQIFITNAGGPSPSPTPNNDGSGVKFKIQPSIVVRGWE